MLLAGGLLPLLVSCMVLMRPNSSTPALKVNPVPVLREGHSLPDSHIHSIEPEQGQMSPQDQLRQLQRLSSSVTAPAPYAELFLQLKRSPDAELGKYAPQLANFLIDKRTADAMHELSPEQSLALVQFEEVVLKRCASNFMLGFRVYCAVKVWCDAFYCDSCNCL